MNTDPIIIERSYNAPIDLVWEALTDKNKMKEWYFDLEAFSPTVDFEFSFTGGTPERSYLHLCRITEVVPKSRLAYTWRYDGYGGESLVLFELFEEGAGTKLKLTHSGLHTFPAENPDLAKSNFVAGWTSILGESLLKYLTH